MPFSARIRPNVFAASMNAGSLPGPEAQYTQIDLIVLMGKGCGAAGAGRQGSPREWLLPAIARRCSAIHLVCENGPAAEGCSWRGAARYRGVGFSLLGCLWCGKGSI